MRITEIHQILSNAVMSNDWNTAYEDVFKEDPFKNSKYLTAKISKKGDNALHLASKNNSIEFVKELIKYMLKEELDITNDDGDTAFLLATENGSMKIVKAMFEKNRWLPSIRGNSEDLPIHRATQLGHKKMAKFLYRVQGPLQEIDSSRLFLNLRNRVSLFDDSHDSWRKNRNLEKLCKAASTNDWNGAYNDIFDSNPLKYSTYLTARVSRKEDTALHMAAVTKSFNFVEELLKYMKEEGLAIKNSDGNTAFFLLAASGNVRLAKEMCKKNEELPFIRGEKKMLPIHKAVEQGHEFMVEFLHTIQGPLEDMDSKLLDNWWLDQRIKKQLSQATCNNDWNVAREVYEEHPDYTKAIISQKGDTALHITISKQYFVFAKNLVNKMNSKDLEIKNHEGNTAFHLVVASGNLELAKKMFDKNRVLRSIHDGKKMLPIIMAVQFGHKEIFKFLYKDFLSISNEDKYLNEEDHLKLIHGLIRIGIYDIALELLKKKPQLATHHEESDGETALHILARNPNFPNEKGLGSDEVQQEKWSLEARELVKWLWQQIRYLKLDENEISQIIDHPWPVIFDAVEQKNIHFLASLIHEFPNLILRVNENNYSIFHVAVLNRQNEIFKLIHDIDPELKKSIFQYKDEEKNNILHLAGKMPPQEWLNNERLHNISEVASRWQQESFWFEEVKKIMDPKHVGAKNKDMKTPTDLFNKKMTDLKDKDEKWMKEIANSCMIVATLITTVAFAAALTVPGGTKDDTGTPHFIQEVSFIIFVISDAIALASSSWSILEILSIYTTRYTEVDIHLLPKNVVVGLSSLLLSLQAVMVLFCATVFIVFKNGKIWVPILASVIAFLPFTSSTMQKLLVPFHALPLIFEKKFFQRQVNTSLLKMMTTMKGNHGA